MSLQYCVECSKNIDTDYKEMYSETTCMECALSLGKVEDEE